MNNTNSRIYKKFKQIRDSGLESVINIRTAESHNSAAKPLENIKEYKDKVRKLIKESKPTVLSVEYKESSSLFFKGTQTDYLNILNCTKEVIQELDVKTKLTNGGFEGDILALMCYADLLSKPEKSDEADKFSKKAFDEAQLKIINNPMYRNKLNEILREGARFLDTYKLAELDYINIHWSINNPDAFEECVKYVTKRTGLKVISTEMEIPSNRDMVNDFMNRVSKLNIPCAIWYFPVGEPDNEELIDKAQDKNNSIEKFKKFIKSRYSHRAKLRRHMFIFGKWWEQINEWVESKRNSRNLNVATN